MSDPISESMTTKPRANRRSGGGRAGRQATRAAPLTEDKKAIWPGMIGGSYKPLSDLDLTKIIDAAFTILETIGMGEAPDSHIRLATAKGAWLKDNGRICYPRSMVEDILDGAAKSFVLHGRDPKHDLDISGSRVHYGTGGAAVNVLDFHTGRYRETSLVDLYDFARLADHLDNVHWFTRSVVARDVLDDFALDANTVYACAAATTKHIGTSFVFGSHVKPIVQMFDAMLGEEGGFKKRPFCKVHISPVVSPLRFGEDAVSVAEAAIPEGMPVNAIMAAQSGATAPATLAGMLAQTTAEILAALIVVNLIKPGHPMIFSNWPFVVDLRTGAFACGGAEIALLNAASAQISNALSMPSGVAAGMADSKVPDAQAGYEKAVSAVACGLAGANLIYESSGMFASLLSASFEGMVLDNDIVGTALRVVRGIEVNDETLGLEAIAEVTSGPNHFLGHAQTLDTMQSHYYYPEASDREPPETWEEQGSRTSWDLLKARTSEILNSHYPRYLDKSVDEKIRSKFPIALKPEDMEAKNLRF